MARLVVVKLLRWKGLLKIGEEEEVVVVVVVVIEGRIPFPSWKMEGYCDGLFLASSSSSR